MKNQNLERNSYTPVRIMVGGLAVAAVCAYLYSVYNKNDVLVVSHPLSTNQRLVSDEYPNEDVYRGKWLEFKGKIQKNWGKITDDEVNEMKGESKELQGKLQQKYGYTKEEARKEIDSFLYKLGLKK